jgi:hypothetical protein
MIAEVRPSFVLAAVEDDGNCAEILAYAREQAHRQRLPLRIVHVWTRRERMADSDRLLTAALYENLPPDEADTVERQILHDDDPARALAALSRDAALLVAATGSPGETVNRLADLAACPLAILPTVPRITRGH